MRTTRGITTEQALLAEIESLEARLQAMATQEWFNVEEFERVHEERERLDLILEARVVWRRQAGREGWRDVMTGQEGRRPPQAVLENPEGPYTIGAGETLEVDSVVNLDTGKTTVTEARIGPARGFRPRGMEVVGSVTSLGREPTPEVVTADLYRTSSDEVIVGRGPTPGLGPDLAQGPQYKDLRKQGPVDEYGRPAYRTPAQPLHEYTAPQLGPWQGGYR